MTRRLQITLLTETTRISHWSLSYSGYWYGVGLWDTGLSLMHVNRFVSLARESKSSGQRETPVSNQALCRYLCYNEKIRRRPKKRSV